MTVIDPTRAPAYVSGRWRSRLSTRCVASCLSGLLLAGCGQESGVDSGDVETIHQSAGELPAAADDSGAAKSPDNSRTTEMDPSRTDGDIFNIGPNGITLIGSSLSRNGILNQLVAFDGAEQHGGPLIDQPVNVNVSDGSIGEVLAQLLDGISYQARFEKADGERTRLHSLWLGEDAMKPQLVVQQVAADASGALISPLTPADGSLDAGEDYVKVISRQYADGDSEARKMAIMDVEVTEGGVAFLANVMQTAQDEEVLIEAIRRLEIGEEFGAKWALLESLAHPNPVIVLEILESIEVWRDPTIKKYIEPLTFHGNTDVREKALELVDDLNSYAEVGVAADPYGIEQATRPQLTPQQRQEMEERQKDKHREGRQKIDNLREKQQAPGNRAS